QVTWQDAIERWAQAIKEALAAAGPQAIGVLGGGRLLNEEAYALQHLFRRLGVGNLDWRGGRQRQATPGADAGSPTDLEDAQAIVVLGQSPAETAPILDLRIRKAVMHRGAACIAIATLDPAPPYSCQTVASVREAIGALPESAQRIAIVWDGVDAASARELVAALQGRAALKTFIAGEQPNARGAEAVGMHPVLGPGFTFLSSSGRDFAGMIDDARAGKLHVLCILGANPALHFPDGEAIREALARTPFVVLTELFPTQTAEAANLLLPVAAPFEKSGTTMNVAGDLLPVNAARKAPENSHSDLEIIAGLAQALDVEMPSIDEVHERVIDCAAAPREFSLGDERLCGAHAAAKPPSDELRVAVQSRIFAGGGTVAHDPWIEELRPLPEAAVSPAVAQRLEIATGDCIDLQGGSHTMHDLLVEVRPSLPDGVVAIIDGLPDDPANCFGEDSTVSVVNVRRSRELAGAAS
ncbi:MAG: molybdopterin-dependent oxidoreductase, partial [Candidatus Eremiobacteraeota bacterium]|nr:molybdopterin-dependent oxidoreductase [Candidatus Eremiobacteraeota bacterium]